MPSFVLALTVAVALWASADATGVLSVGESCLEEGSICADGFLCAGTLIRKKCVRPMSIGQRCGGDPFWVCAPGIECLRHSCRDTNIPEGGNCLPAGSICAQGTVCAGSDESKICTVPIQVGGPCTSADPFSICADGFNCDGMTCVSPPVPEGGDCTPNYSTCEDGTVCIGKKMNKKCVTPVPENGPCTANKYSICVDGFQCIKRVCQKSRVPEGGYCNDKASICAHKTVCAGDDGSRLCVIPSVIGGICDDDQYSVCPPRYECIDGTCQKPPVSEGGNCKKAGSVCVDGTVCVGHKFKKKCVVPGGPGAICGNNRFQVCADGLSCLDKECKSPKVPEGGDCLPSGSTCIDGTICIGSDSNKKCVGPTPIGGGCDAHDIFSICATGLVCDDETCSEPKIPRHGDCTSNQDNCIDWTVCAGTTEKKYCVIPMPEGKGCDVDPYWICEIGLECKDHICRKPQVPVNGECLHDASLCEEGTICAGQSDYKLCVHPMNIGERCGSDPYWVCATGVRCENGVCAAPRVPRNGDCLPHGSVCVEGTVCAGTSTRKICVTPMGTGESCGSDPYWVCEGGTTCHRGICAGPERHEGESCSHSSPCGSGLYCGYSSWYRQYQCNWPAREGYSCGTSAPCASGLHCWYGRCRGYRSRHHHW